MHFRALCYLFFMLGAPSCVRAQDTLHVYFPVNVSTLSPAKEQMIRSVIQSKTTYQKVQVYGYTDRTGNKALNDTLSIARANNVKRFITQNGINESQVRVCIGLGEIVTNGGNKEKEHDRKVDVVFLKPEGSYGTIHLEKNVKDICCKDMKANELDIDDVLPLNDVFFSLGSINIPDSSKPQLNQLAQFLLDNPTITISIEGHLCICQWTGGTYEPDTGISSKSFQRAAAVANYLVGKGVDKVRMPIAGLGEDHPFVWPERTQSDEALNRRAAIRIISK